MRVSARDDHPWIGLGAPAHARSTGGRLISRSAKLGSCSRAPEHGKVQGGADVIGRKPVRPAGSRDAESASMAVRTRCQGSPSRRVECSWARGAAAERYIWPGALGSSLRLKQSRPSQTYTPKLNYPSRPPPDTIACSRPFLPSSQTYELYLHSTCLLQRTSPRGRSRPRLPVS